MSSHVVATTRLENLPQLQLASSGASGVCKCLLIMLDSSFHYAYLPSEAQNALDSNNEANWTSGTADQSLHIRTANRCKGLDFNWLNALNLTNDSHEGQCSYIQMYYNCSGCMGKLPLRFTAAHSNRSGSIYLVGMDRSIGLSYYNQRNQAQSMD